MRLAIVGSVCLEGSQKAQEAIRSAFDRWKPTVLISGGAMGIDSMAETEARERGIPCEIHLPAAPNWSLGYKPRNILIAKGCDVLVRIWSPKSKSYGSGWTRDYASDLGKPTEAIMIEE